MVIAMKRFLLCACCVISLLLSASCAQLASEGAVDASVGQSSQTTDRQFAIRVVDKKGHGIVEASVCPTQQNMVKTTLDGYVYNCPLNRGQQILIVCDGYRQALVTYSGPGMVVGLDRDYSRTLASGIVWLIIAVLLVIMARKKAIPDVFMLFQSMLFACAIGRLGRYLAFSWKLVAMFVVVMLILAAAGWLAVKYVRQNREPDVRMSVAMKVFLHLWMISVFAVQYFFFTTEKKPAFIFYFVLALLIAAVDVILTLKRNKPHSRLDSAAGN